MATSYNFLLSTGEETKLEVTIYSVEKKILLDKGVIRKPCEELHRLMFVFYKL